MLVATEGSKVVWLWREGMFCVEGSVNALLLGYCISQDVDTVYVDLLDSRYCDRLLG